MTIKEIANKTLQEIEKAKKEPYPLYYKEIFNFLARQEHIKIDPILNLDLSKSISGEFLHHTKEVLGFMEQTNTSIEDNSKELIQEFEIKNVHAEILELVRKFEADLLAKLSESNQKINELNKELHKAYKQLHIDTLTKTYNRQALKEDIATLIKCGKKRELDSAILVFDLDHFKEINDTYGHLVGDFVLIKVANMIKNTIRCEDKIYRFGGDEFVVIFNRINKKMIEKIALKVKNAVSAKKLKYKEHILNITISVGVACHKQGDSEEDWFNRADEALYESKNTRNKVTIKC